MATAPSRGLSAEQAEELVAAIRAGRHQR
jgi:hypothetical protein